MYWAREMCGDMKGSAPSPQLRHLIHHSREDDVLARARVPLRLIQVTKSERERASSLTVAVGDQIISLPSESSQSVVRPSVSAPPIYLATTTSDSEEMPRGRKQIDFAPPSLTHSPPPLSNRGTDALRKKSQTESSGY